MINQAGRGEVDPSRGVTNYTLDYQTWHHAVNKQFIQYDPSNFGINACKKRWSINLVDIYPHFKAFVNSSVTC